VLSPDLAADLAARWPGGRVPGAIRAQAVAAIRAGIITQADVARQLAVASSAVAAWMVGKVERRGERAPPIQPAARWVVEILGPEAQR
jgi:hypothetical protein